MRASTPKAVSEPKTPGTGPAFRLPFDNSFFRDMQGFYVPWKPEPSPAPAWVTLSAGSRRGEGLPADSTQIRGDFRDGHRDLLGRRGEG